MYKLIDEGPKPLIAANTVDFYANIIKNYFFYIYIYIVVKEEMEITEWKKFSYKIGCSLRLQTHSIK